jgi:hypothetical protein
MLEGTSSASPDKCVLADLAKAGGIHGHELDVLASWWDEVLCQLPRMKWCEPLMRGRKGRAKRLHEVAKAGRKFLNEIIDDEIRRQLIAGELIRTREFDYDGANAGSAEEFFRQEIDFISAPIREEIEAIKRIIARLEKQAHQLGREKAREGTNSKHIRRVIALDIYDIWVRRLRRPFIFKKDIDGDFITFALAVYKHAGEPYSEEGTLEKQLGRWLSRYRRPGQLTHNSKANVLR